MTSAQQSSRWFAIVEWLAPRLAGFCQSVEKNSFSVVKTELAKTVFAGKNRFFAKIHQDKILA